MPYRNNIKRTNDLYGPNYWSILHSVGQQFIAPMRERREPVMRGDWTLLRSSEGAMHRRPYRDPAHSVDAPIKSKKGVKAK